MSTTLEPVIGLEVHAELLTASKIFCRCSAAFGGPPNTDVCPVCLGMPGVLPVLNRRVVEFAIRAGLATHCTIAERSRYARKNYFYPDLPKGYQISMYELPLCTAGWLDVLVDGTSRRIGLTRIHMEEDTGKNIHDAHGDASLVDYNRSGVPLLEIVSEPDMRNVAEAGAYLRTLRSILQYLEICDGNMEEGSFRCDANVSVRPAGTTALGTKVEIKNMNSFRAVEKAIAFEIARQSEAARARRSRQASAWCRRRACGTPTARRRGRCAARSTRTTTATSPSRTCSRWSSSAPGWPRSRPRCPSCPPRAASASCATSASRRTTPTCSRSARTSPTTSRPASPPARRRRRWRTG
jgi:aspartyl/glutamyl-tRNA(Asn/Gln) amidotransferase B subunit